MGSIRDEIIDKYDEECAVDRRKTHQETIERLRSKIGSNDKTIRKVVEVLYQELKRF